MGLAFGPRPAYCPQRAYHRKVSPTHRLQNPPGGVMAVELTDAQRRTISALADTYVAAVPSPTGQDPDGFYARTGTEAGAPIAVEIALSRIDPALAGGLLTLVDALGQFG